MSKVKDLTKSLSHFTVESKSKFENSDKGINPLYAVLMNLLERGMPTLVNKETLDFFLDKSDMLSRNEKNPHIIDVAFDSFDPELVFRSFHVIDPRLDAKSLKQSYAESWENLGSAYEEGFLFDELPKYIKDGDFLIQLLSQQRSIKSIIEDKISENAIAPAELVNFMEQRTDFSLSFPYHNGLEGIVIEIDGPQHKEVAQKNLDIRRDRIVAQANWAATTRIPTEAFGNISFKAKVDDLWHKIDNEGVFILSYTL